ncbi:MAG: hypothetical protein H6581_07305 [Bacteroidia bacterium]|nr:hypothetical protein [Bacteroidia bacterium]
MEIFASSNPFPNRFFTLREIAGAILIFLLCWLALGHLAWYGWDIGHKFPISKTWPVKIMGLDFKHSKGQWIFAFAQPLILLVFLRTLIQFRFHWVLSILFGMGMIFFSNLTHSWDQGFVMPHSGSSAYYADVGRVNGLLDFISSYNEIQPQLSIHSRTHPPGAVLTFRLLDWLGFGNKGMISVWILLFAGVISGTFLNRFLQKQVDRTTAGFLTFLYFLIPAVLIYYVSCLDALIAAYTVGFIFFLSVERIWLSIIGLSAFIFLFSFTNFAFLFLIPVLGAWEIFVKKNFLRTLTTVSVIVLIYLGMYYLLGYNYLKSFEVARYFEDPDPLPLAERLPDYFWGRAMDLGEILIFAGPFFLMLLWKSLKPLWKEKKSTFLLISFSLLSLVAVFLGGAYKVGETGRACLFIFPFLFLSLTGHFAGRKIKNEEAYLLAGLFFINGLLMQFFGDFFW